MKPTSPATNHAAVCSRYSMGAGVTKLRKLQIKPLQANLRSQAAQRFPVDASSIGWVRRLGAFTM